MKLTSVLLFFLVPLSIAVLGVLAVRRAFLGRRRGHTPHCAGCDYNLTGIDGSADDARCPECGAALDKPNAIVEGRRVFRRGMLVFGLLATLSGGALSLYTGAAIVKHFDWYHYKPTRWVFQDIHGSNQQRILRGLFELSRRNRDGDLTAEQREELIRSALQFQASPNLSNLVGTVCANTLGGLYNRGELSPEQLERMCEASQIVEVKARERVPLDHMIPATLAGESRAPLPLFADGKIVGVRIDGVPVEVKQVTWDALTCMSKRDVRFKLPAAPLGKHTIECDVRLLLRKFNEKTTKFEPDPVYDRQRTLRCEIEVVDEPAASLIKRTADPGLESAITAAIGHVSFYVSNRFDFDQQKLAPTLCGTMMLVSQAPANIAFDVTAEFDHRRVKLGQLSASAGARWFTSNDTLEGTIPFDMPPEIDIVLTASEDVAIETFDQTEIWDGEIRFHVKPQNYDRLAELEALTSQP